MSVNNEHLATGSVLTKEPRLINRRFSLRRILSRTALADIFWAHDLQGTAESQSEQNVLVLLVNHSVAHLESFPTAWQQILNRPAPPAAAYPDIVAFGEDKGDYWLVVSNINGMLLSEQIAELKQRGQSLNTALETLHSINQALSGIQAGAFGYIEPGALQQTDRGAYKVLNAPLVKVMQLLAASRPGTINKLALHSAYLSPSVAVGDAPVTEDDTFSSTSLLYTLLSGKPPFGEQSTLTAVAHGDSPLPLKPLKKESRAIIQQALTYQRSARPENPEKLLSMLKKSNRTKLALPIAALASLSVAVFAGQHLIDRLDHYLQSTTSDSHYQTINKQAQQQSTQSSLLAPQATTHTILSTQNAQVQQVPTPNNINLTATKAANTAVITPRPIAQATAQQATPATTVSPKLTKQTLPEKTPVTTPSPDTTTAQANDQQLPDADTKLFNATATTSTENNTGKIIRPTETKQQTASVAVQKSADEATDTNRVAQQNIASLLKQASAAFNVGRLEDSTSGKTGAITLLRDVINIDDENTEATALLKKVIEKKYNAAERALKKKAFATAENTLQESDRLIREFMLTDKLQRQVKMESKLAILSQEQEQINALLKDARIAIRLGNLSQSDGKDNALSYLSRVMFKQPGNKKGKKLINDIVSVRQTETQRALNDGDIDKARNSMSESKRLIRRYKLSQPIAEQKALEEQYNAALTGQLTEQVNRNSNGIETAQLAPEQNQTQQDNNLIAEPLPTEKLAPNPIAIQETTLDQVSDNPELLQPEQVFVPEANTSVAQAQAVPIWEASDLQQLQANGQVAQAVVVYDDPTAPVTELQPLGADVQYLTATPNNEGVLTTFTYSTQTQEQYPIVEFQQEILEPADNMVPELEEIPVADIQEIFITQE